METSIKSAEPNLSKNERTNMTIQKSRRKLGLFCCVFVSFNAATSYDTRAQGDVSSLIDTYYQRCRAGSNFHISCTIQANKQSNHSNMNNVVQFQSGGRAKTNFLPTNKSFSEGSGKPQSTNNFLNHSNNKSWSLETFKPATFTKPASVRLTSSTLKLR